MKIDGKPYRSIWRADGRVSIIDQTVLPHELSVVALADMAAAAHAIRDMQVRGAPLIGATAAYGLALALEEDASDGNLAAAHATLLATRPTAINLRWALDRMRGRLAPLAASGRAAAAMAEADRIADEDVAINAAIGEHGLALIRAVAAAKPAGQTLNILTHCNAGWIATVDWGTALAPIYKAHDAGIDVHVWVDETRPRNQGAALTAWELGAHGVPHHVIVDNAGGHLMQHGLVDLCIVGTDRVTADGDVCNKIGTYLKALAAKDNNVPFYVALPTPTIDWTIGDGVAEIPIEQRSTREVTHVQGVDDAGVRRSVRITPAASPARNDAFDVTPARLVSGLITEAGVIEASAAGLAGIRARAGLKEPNMAAIEARLKSLGVELPPLPAPIGNYAPFRIGGNTLYLSGVGPRRHDGGVETGRVGQDVSVEAAYGHARLCGLNMLAIMAQALGDLDRVECMLKVLGMVNAVPGFEQHPRVIDGCTDLFVEVFGEAGKPARSAVGMGSLPRNISVEVEGVVLIRP